MRHLHTLKGGSNMIQARHIGLIAHELETIYEKLINHSYNLLASLLLLFVLYKMILQIEFKRFVIRKLIIHQHMY
jgi:chemotaxis protein histidine kinase CheA